MTLLHSHASLSKPSSRIDATGAFARLAASPRFGALGTQSPSQRDAFIA
ncbi:MAG TPA: hypothetical protein VFN09_06180 [Rhodanobacteraceae bacterium]|nr:hypothetical protein [Rhodanobacteraceae bacterium]